MRRAILIHWRQDEGIQRLPALQAAGWQAECFTPENGNLRPVRESPPEAFVIDLSRLPGHGREVGAALRRYAQTRHVPLIFAGGTPDKVQRAQESLPDAVYCEWDRIAEALSEALRNAPDEPVVPSAMAAYSGTPLPKRLGIREGTRLTLLHAPQGFLTKLSLPSGVTVHQRNAQAERVILFARDTEQFEREFPKAVACLAPGGGLWIAWPKKASGVATDLSQTGIRQFAIAHGYVDYKVCAIDEMWSGLLFAPKKIPNP